MFTEPLADFFNTAELAVDATWSVGGTVQVIFDAPHSEVLIGEGVVSSTAPSCTVRTAQVPGIEVGQTITIGTATYTVRDVQPDGVNGVTRLWLQAA